jgi:hypothetical protein
MASRSGSEQYGAILIRGATGQLWYMRSDGEKPDPIDDEELEGQLSALAQTQPEGMFTFPLPADVKQRLEKSLGGVVPWGVIIWWAHRLSK